MNTRKIAPLLLFFLGLLLPLLPQNAFAQGKLAPGDQVPDYTFKTLAGKTVKLSQFKGKNIVLAFMVHGSGACHSFAPKLEKDIWRAFKGRNTVVLGVLVRARKAKQFKQSHGLSFPVAVDNRLAAKFPSDGYPFVAILDGKGCFRFSTKGVAAKRMIPQIITSLKKLGA
ncbi:MAG: TlpA disulfide reductase family protein [Planctomycetota bacterium]|nr:TlpA disulfide reductase family protein [Planctomycetota bacterium]